MKINFLIIGIIAVLVIGAGIYFFTQQSYTAPPANNPPASSGSTTHDVEISGFAFNPSEVTINAGDTVTWTNMDSVTHTITSDSGSELSGSLNNGGTYSHTFNSAGTFDYHCSIHTSMKGKIIVQ